MPIQACKSDNNSKRCSNNKKHPRPSRIQGELVIHTEQASNEGKWKEDMGHDCETSNSMSLHYRLLSNFNGNSRRNSCDLFLDPFAHSLKGSNEFKKVCCPFSGDRFSLICSLPHFATPLTTHGRCSF